MTRSYFDTIDQLNKLWTEFEKVVAVVYIKDETGRCPLHVERHGTRLRLMYEGVTMPECKAKDKVDAVEFVPEFLRLFREYAGEKVNVARAACEKLAKHIEDVKLWDTMEDK